MGQFAKGKRPQLATIKEAVAYLEDLGLSVYGSMIDLDTGERAPGCRDFTAAQIARLRELTEKDEIHYPTHY